jgi:hypothetical protein
VPGAGFTGTHGGSHKLACRALTWQGGRCTQAYVLGQFCVQRVSWLKGGVNIIFDGLADCCWSLCWGGYYMGTQTPLYCRGSLVPCRGSLVPTCCCFSNILSDMCSLQGWVRADWSDPVHVCAQQLCELTQRLHLGLSKAQYRECGEVHHWATGCACLCAGAASRCWQRQGGVVGWSSRVSGWLE